MDGQPTASSSRYAFGRLERISATIARAIIPADVPADVEKGGAALLALSR
jgi:hypothetical protein